MIDTTRPVRRDVYARQRLFGEASFRHHGKANLFLVEQLLMRFSDPGDLVLDPMAGTGTVYVGLLGGRRVIAGDIEAEWAGLLRDNLACCSRGVFGFATLGGAVRWDAGALPMAAEQADLCITSPPYFDCFSDWEGGGSVTQNVRQGENGLSYGLHAGQIANLHVYESYLAAMRRVYAECWRVTRPGGKLILIVKDVIRGGRVVPVVDDNATLGQVSGYALVERYDVPVRGSRFRNVNRVRIGQAGPQTETALVLERCDLRPAERLALVEFPRAGDGPGRTIATKAVAHAAGRGFEVWGRSPGESGFRRASFGAVCDYSAAPPGETGFRCMVARYRREFAFGLARELVDKAGLVAGDEVAFYGSDERYGRYLCRRLETLGLQVTRVLYGLNNGQRLAFLTPSSAAFSPALGGDAGAGS